MNINMITELIKHIYLFRKLIDFFFVRNIKYYGEYDLIKAVATAVATINCFFY